MALYVDTSALLKRYADEPESDQCVRYLAADPVRVTARHTLVEVRRNLARKLAGEELAAARAEFAEDWRDMTLVEMDERTCELAAQIAESTGVRSLDALHLAAMSRAGGSALSLLTFDVRQARAARTLGFTVLGV